MRATLAAAFCVLGAWLAAVVQADAAVAYSAATGVTLGRPVLRKQAEGEPVATVRGQEPDASPAANLPTLGKPIVVRKVEEHPADAPPPAAPADAPQRREPPVYADHRPVLQPPAQPPVDKAITPVSFVMPPPLPESVVTQAKPAVPAGAEAKPAEKPAEKLAQPKPAETTSEELPMPRERPTILLPDPAAWIPGPEDMHHQGPVMSGGYPYSRPATWWERLCCKVKGKSHNAGWVPARINQNVYEQHAFGSTSVLCPDLCCTDPCAETECHRMYGSSEYLLWRLRNLDVPPLVTTTRDPVNEVGAIGEPNTQILVGGEIDYGHLSGFRSTFGIWLNPCHTLAIEGSYFFLENGEFNQRYSSDATGNPLLARPFFDELSGSEAVQLVSDPGVLAGAVSVGIETRLWGAELNLRHPLVQNRPWHGWCKDVHLLVGARYLDLEDSVSISEDLVALLEIPEREILAGTNFRINDSFQTRNQFYGGQIGLEKQLRRGCWVIDLKGKVALGVTHQEIAIDGYSVRTDPGAAPVRIRGGLLTQSSNIGRYHSEVFSIVPEAGINIGYQVTCRTRVFVGYSLLYWTNVARADQQIDRVVNSGFLQNPQIPGSRPAFLHRDRDFWAHGLNVGVEMKY